MSSPTTARALTGISTLALKVPCKAATTAAITLNGEQTIDGVVCVTGDRVLVKTQTSGVENGIYVVDTGQWRRASDCDGALDLVYGSSLLVAQGTLNRGFWRCVTADPIIVDTTSLTFSFGASSAVITTLGDLLVGGAAGVPSRLAAGTNGYVLEMISGTPSWQPSPTGGSGGIGTPVNTTSGTNVMVASGLAATVKRIDVQLRGVRLNGNNQLTIEYGSSGGFTGSGQHNYSSLLTGTMDNANNTVSTGRFILNQTNNASTDTLYGRIKATLIDAANFRWAVRWKIGSAARGLVHWGDGEIILAAVLTQVRLNTAAGSASFTAGIAVPIVS